MAFLLPALGALGASGAAAGGLGAAGAGLGGAGAAGAGLGGLGAAGGAGLGGAAAAGIPAASGISGFKSIMQKLGSSQEATPFSPPLRLMPQMLGEPQRTLRPRGF